MFLIFLKCCAFFFNKTFPTVLKLLDVPELLKHFEQIIHPSEQESTICTCHLMVTPLRIPTLRLQMFADLRQKGCLACRKYNKVSSPAQSLPGI